MTALPVSKSWLKRVWNLLQFGFTLVFTGAGIPVALALLKLSGSTHLPLRMASRFWALVLFFGAGVKVDVRGVDTVDWTRPHLIVCNHESVIDIPVMFYAVPVPLRFILKQEMTRMPLVGRYARAMGMLFIDRDNPRAAPAMLKAAADMLANGWQLCVFPEGTRSRDGALLDFKAGPFEAAVRAGVDVLPVALEGCGQVLPSDGFAVNRGRIRVSFGAAIPAKGPDGDLRDRNTLATLARDAVIAMQDNDRQS